MSSKQTKVEIFDDARDVHGSGVMIALGESTRSLWTVHSDTDLEKFLSEIPSTVASCYGKKKTDLTVEDIDRVVTQLAGLAKILRIDKITLTQALLYRDSSACASTSYKVLRWASAIAESSGGSLRPLFTAVAKDVAGKRMRNAATIFCVAYFYSLLYRDSASDELPVCIDSVLLAMTRDELKSLGRLLEIEIKEEVSTHVFAAMLSSKMASEARDQSLTRAWFPRVATSYAEVVVVVAKRCEVNIQGLMTVEEIEHAILQKVLPITGIARDDLILSGILSGIHLTASDNDEKISSFVVNALVSAGVSLHTIAFPFLAGAVATFENRRARPERLVGAIAFIAAWRRFHSRLASKLYENARNEHVPDFNSTKSVVSRSVNFNRFLICTFGIIVGSVATYIIVNWH